jgi:muconate cycloisomerase
MQDKQSQVSRITLNPLAIPMRKAFKHAAHERSMADPIVVAVELASGAIGFGETLPRPYVSGETCGSVLQDVEAIFVPRVLEMRPGSLPEGFELLEGLPFVDRGGRCIVAARAGVELALLDAYSRHFRRPLSDAAGWIGLPRFGSPGSSQRVTYSAIVSADEPERLRRSVQKMKCFRLRDFKLKVGGADDDQRVQTVMDVLGKAIDKDMATLRLDANGAWDVATASDCLGRWKDVPISAVEQPLAKGAEKDLKQLRMAVRTPLMYDESLLTLQDAEDLVVRQVADYFNLRLSKNGGFLATLRLVEFARRHQVQYQLGCMVGETSILSAAGRKFIELVPDIAFAEGSYGRFLLRDDVGRPRVRFGLGGKVKPLNGLGWGVTVDAEAIGRLTDGRPTVMNL